MQTIILPYSTAANFTKDYDHLILQRGTLLLGQGYNIFLKFSIPAWIHKCCIKKAALILWKSPDSRMKLECGDCCYKIFPVQCDNYTCSIPCCNCPFLPCGGKYFEDQSRDSVTKIEITDMVNANFARTSDINFVLAGDCRTNIICYELNQAAGCSRNPQICLELNDNCFSKPIMVAKASVKVSNL